MINVEMKLDEEQMNYFIDLTNPDGDFAHRGLNAILRDIMMLGYLHRHTHQITLHNEGVDAEYDEEYQEYLDKRASNMKIERWEDMKHD